MLPLHLYIYLRKEFGWKGNPDALSTQVQSTVPVWLALEHGPPRGGGVATPHLQVTGPGCEQQCQ